MGKYISESCWHKEVSGVNQTCNSQEHIMNDALGSNIFQV